MSDAPTPDARDDPQRDDPHPIRLARMGSFHVGGRTVTVAGLPVAVQPPLVPGGVLARLDPNGRYLVEQMYVQYFVPEPLCGRVPLLLWHGGGMTGVNWETTPDGREGWLNLFLRWGWAVCNCDAVERGRSGWPALPVRLWESDPLSIPIEHAAERFRLDRPGSQFPVAALEQFGRQLVPRWISTDEPTLAAYLALLERTGPSVIVAHSQGGNFAFRAAQQRPDLVRALVAIEPAATGDPQQADVLRDVPVLLVYGDFIEEDPRWPEMRRGAMAHADAVRRAGGHVDLIDLPAQGIRGNSHLLMMERNNREIAALVRTWLQARNLEQAPAPAGGAFGGWTAFAG
jgi:pimeloyl-ACP methyl ester carboxylesterase